MTLLIRVLVFLEPVTRFHMKGKPVLPSCKYWVKTLNNKMIVEMLFALTSSYSQIVYLLFFQYTLDLLLLCSVESPSYYFSHPIFAGFWLLTNLQSHWSLGSSNMTANFLYLQVISFKSLHVLLPGIRPFQKTHMLTHIVWKTDFSLRGQGQVLSWMMLHLLGLTWQVFPLSTACW